MWRRSPTLGMRAVGAALGNTALSLAPNKGKKTAPAGPTKKTTSTASNTNTHKKKPQQQQGAGGNPATTGVREQKLLSPPVARQLPRFVNPLGYLGDLYERKNLVMTDLQPLGYQAVQAALNGENVLLTGCSGTGKFTLANYIVDLLECPDWFYERDVKLYGGLGLGAKEKKRVVRTSLVFRNAFRMEGLFLHSFVGLRYKTGEELPGFDQLTAAFERQVRLMRDAYAGIFPSLETADVLLFDGLHHATPELVRAMDAVARSVRGEPHLPFGGLQVIATADFWRMAVDPASPNHGYLYQDPRFHAEWFPKTNQFYFTKIYRHGADTEFTELTHKSHFGLLKPNDINSLVEMCHNKEIQGIPPNRLVDLRSALGTLHPRFPRQPSKLTPPEHSATLRRLQFGHYMLASFHSGFFASNYRLSDRLNVDVGSIVEMRMGSEDIPRGSLGIVSAVSGDSTRVTVEFPELDRAETILPVQIVTHHPEYEEMKLTLSSFPFVSAQLTYPAMAIAAGDLRHYLLDARMLADTNDLGNILAATCGPSSVRIVPKTIDEFVKREGMVHDPTRIYYEELSGTLANHSERWCRNCKTHVKGSEFAAHWQDCIHSVRWCEDCNTTIDAAKWEPHCEKHTIVMCIDCGSALEWRDWEKHRLSCSPMLRELTAENVMLPSATRDSAMSSGHDRRDLQTVEKISKQRLPKTHLEVIHRSR